MWPDGDVYLCPRFFIDQYFGGVFEVELKCDESEEEPVTKSEESFLQLSCFISQEVKYMNTGLKSVSLLIVIVYVCIFIAKNKIEKYTAWNVIKQINEWTEMHVVLIIKYYG